MVVWQHSIVTNHLLQLTEDIVWHGCLVPTDFLVVQNFNFEVNIDISHCPLTDNKYVYICVKGTVHQYQSHAIASCFTACEIIIKHSFTRVCRVHNKLYLVKNNILVSIVRARKVAIMSLQWTSEEWSLSNACAIY